MMKKMWIIVFVLFILVSFVNAKAICGIVGDSEDNISASWFQVRTYYLTGEETFCQVSPSENKYCCDLEILDPNWEAGDEVFAEVIFENYFAGPVSLEVTNDPYDIFPEMILEKVIKLNSPSERIFFNKTEILFDFDFKEPFTEVYIDKGAGEELLCLGCSSYSWNESVDFGTQEFTLRASGNGYSFYETFYFHNLEWFDVEREFVCEGCRKNKIKGGKNVSTNLYVTLSHSVKNMKIKEFVPSEFEILGEGSNYDLELNSLDWDFSGNNFNEDYNFISPRTKWFPSLHSFFLKFEEEVVDQENVMVFNRIPFNLRFFFKYLDPESVNSSFFDMFYYVSSSNPFVYEDEIMTLGIFPKRSDRIWVSVKKHNFKNFRKRRGEVLKSYLIRTSLSKSNFDSMYFEFSFSDEEILRHENLKFYGLKNGRWFEIQELESHFENGKKIFTFDSNYLKGILVYSR